MYNFDFDFTPLYVMAAVRCVASLYGAYRFVCFAWWAWVAHQYRGAAMTQDKQDLKWFYASSADAETWSGPHDTREEAEGTARIECEGPWYVRQGRRITVETLLDGLYLENIVEGVAEHWSDNYSCPDEDELVTADDTALEALHAWACNHLSCRNWWEMVTPAEEVKP